MYKKLLQDLLTQKEHLQNVLSKILLIVCFLLFFSSSYIANYNTTVDEAWQRWNFLMYFNFTLMFFSLRSEAIKLITKTGYKIILYLLINFYIDKYFGLDSWSWNDFITLILIGVEAVFATIKRIKNERR